MQSLDPDFLRSFLAICETGSYGAAAERVHKTQSTVSAQMKRLEEILGVSLFEKAGRRNTLSPAGLRLLEYARPLLRLNDETLSAFRPPAVSGTVRIGISDDYAQAFLPPVLSHFTRTHPAVDLEIVTGDSGNLVERAEDAAYDAVLISSYAQMEDIEILRTDPLHWIGSETVSPLQDACLPLALWSEGCSWRAKALAALAAAGRDWRLAYTTSNAPLLLSTVRDGIGVTVGPCWYLVPGVRVIEELDAQCPLGAGDIGIKITGDPDSAPLKAFLDLVRVQFRNEGTMAV